MLCASGGGCHWWAFCYDLVKLKLARGRERFLRRRIRMCFHERLALGPLIEILFRSPVSHGNVMIALHRPQDFSFDESWRLCNVPFSFYPSRLLSSKQRETETEGNENGPGQRLTCGEA